MPELKYGRCDCEYPCSCVQFEGKFYGDWKEIIDDLVLQRDTTIQRVVSHFDALSKSDWSDGGGKRAAWAAQEVEKVLGASDV